MADVNVDRLLAEFEREGTPALAAGGAGAGAVPLAVGDDAPVALPLHQRLQAAWLNEKAAPELLPFESDVVAQLIEAVQRQRQEVDDTRTRTADAAFAANLYDMELERIKYLLRGYLRTRLTKARTHARTQTNT
jgi:hypothetical protein